MPQYKIAKDTNGTQNDAPNKATESGRQPGHQSKAPPTPAARAQQTLSLPVGRPGSEVTVWQVPLRPPSSAGGRPSPCPHVVIPFCAHASSSFCEDSSCVGTDATPGTSLNQRADPSPSTSSFRGPAGQGSTRGLAGHQSVRTGCFLRFWVDRNLGGHGLTRHGGCGVNPVLSKGQGGCAWGRGTGHPEGPCSA